MNLFGLNNYLLFSNPMRFPDDQKSFFKKGQNCWLNKFFIQSSLKWPAGF